MYGGNISGYTSKSGATHCSYPAASKAWLGHTRTKERGKEKEVRGGNSIIGVGMTKSRTKTTIPNMEPHPDEYLLTIHKRMVYLSGKRYVRNNKMRLDRFMELSNITSTQLDDHDIVFPKLYEIYSLCYYS
jgi:hypothetical protein